MLKLIRFFKGFLRYFLELSTFLKKLIIDFFKSILIIRIFLRWVAMVLCILPTGLITTPNWGCNSQLVSYEVRGNTKILWLIHYQSSQGSHSKIYSKLSVSIEKSDLNPQNLSSRIMNKHIKNNDIFIILSIS